MSSGRHSQFTRPHRHARRRPPQRRWSVPRLHAPPPRPRGARGSRAKPWRAHRRADPRLRREHPRRARAGAGSGHRRQGRETALACASVCVRCRPRTRPSARATRLPGRTGRPSRLAPEFRRALAEHGGAVPHRRHDRCAQAGAAHARQPVARCLGAACMFGTRDTDVILNGCPLFHVAGSFVFGLSTLLAGGADVPLASDANTRLSLNGARSDFSNGAMRQEMAASSVWPTCASSKRLSGCWPPRR